MAVAVLLSLDALRWRAERRAPRRGHLGARACVGEGGVRVRVARCLRGRLDAGSRLGLSP